MSFKEDFSAFFNTAEFADPAALTPAAGGLSIAGVVIYDDNGTLLEDYNVVTVGPSVIFPAEQWPDADEADLLEIIFPDVGSRSYRLRSKRLLDDGKIALAELVRS